MVGKPRTGLVSISFRNKSVEEIIELCRRAGLDYIEWGSDVHVPAGNVERAKEVRNLTENAGLRISSYGSYYKVGSKMGFEEVLASAKALGAPIIRVWAGTRPSRDVDEEYYNRMVEDGIRIRELASAVGIRLDFEYHRNTMTDNIVSARRIMDDTGINSYWQPNPEISYEEKINEVTELRRQLEIIHVYAWTFKDGENIRHMLSEQMDEWEDYSFIAGTENIYLLEFAKDDDEENIVKDAKTLKDILLG